MGIYVVSIQIPEDPMGTMAWGSMVIRTFESEMKRLARNGWVFGFDYNALAFVQLSDGSYWLSFGFAKLDKPPAFINPDAE